MKEALIKLYKKVEIDTNSNWENAKLFHEYSHKELVHSFKFAQHTFTTWDQLQRNIPDVINPIENKVRQSILQLIYSLKGKVPGQFLDSSGSIDIPFKNIEFRIIESDIQNIDNHKIEVKFITDFLTLIDSFQNKILVAEGDLSYELRTGEEIRTFDIELNKNVGIISYKKFEDL